MHIADLVQSRTQDHIYRCDSMPPNRWRLFGMLEGDVYLRPDGTTEPFTGLMDDRRYHADETWIDCGPIQRTKSGGIDLASLPVAP